ncbi:MAG TPA: hypothetical protein VEV81_10390 [Pyrinomonadaceae bacterium]|nr:hypothetical protein [Pyrinomonadaceae bacterium]
MFIWIGLVVNGLIILAAILYRAAKGKRRIQIPEHDITFSEKWASGASHKNMLTKLGGARNCLAVVLSKNALVVRPMFPFNLAFFSEIYDLEHYIPRNRIKRIEPDESAGRGRVVIEYESESGEKQIELVLKKKQEFLRAVGM